MLEIEHQRARTENLSLEAMVRFVEASEEIRFESQNREQVYGWMERVLVQQEYAQRGKAARGLVRGYIEKMNGLSRAQVTRLIARYGGFNRKRDELLHLQWGKTRCARIEPVSNPRPLPCRPLP